MTATCIDIMIPDPVILHPQMTFKEVFPIVKRIGTRYLPVVDDRGDFIGVFSSMTLIKLLLPGSISLGMGKNPFELNFMQTTLEELGERLHTIGEECIDTHILTDPDAIPTCHPNTSIMEALNLLYHYHYHTVILEKDSRRFLGVVTIKGVLDAISRINPTEHKL